MLLRRFNFWYWEEKSPTYSTKEPYILRQKSPIQRLFHVIRCLVLRAATMSMCQCCFAHWIDWFWLRGWLNNKGALCSLILEFWYKLLISLGNSSPYSKDHCNTLQLQHTATHCNTLLISLFERSRTRLIGTIGSRNQSISVNSYSYWEQRPHTSQMTKEPYILRQKNPRYSAKRALYSVSFTWYDVQSWEQRLHTSQMTKEPCILRQKSPKQQLFHVIWF